MSTKPKHFILYSHGFGYQKDSNGMFTQIKDHLSQYLPDSEHVLFDYNIVNHDKNELTINPFFVQIGILKKHIDEIKSKYPDSAIDIIAHSQGCLITALLCPTEINKTILIAPPVTTSIERMLKRFNSRKGTIIDFSGESRLARSDGSFSIVMPQYWTDRANSPEPNSLYLKLAKATDLNIIIATQDEISKNGSLDVEGAKLIKIDVNHNFTGESRDGLLEALGRIL